MMAPTLALRRSTGGGRKDARVRVIHMMEQLLTHLREHLLAGQVIPAHPLALNSSRKLDERRQRALTQYYFASGAGGIAVAVHTTQFEIRDSQHGLLKPVLDLASRTAHEELERNPRPFAKI